MTEQSSGSGEGDLNREHLAQDQVTIINTNQILSVGYGG